LYTCANSHPIGLEAARGGVSWRIESDARLV
jgi:hypothetical protein